MWIATVDHRQVEAVLAGTRAWGGVDRNPWKGVVPIGEVEVAPRVGGVDRNSTSTHADRDERVAPWVGGVDRNSSTPRGDGLPLRDRLRRDARAGARGGDDRRHQPRALERFRRRGARPAGRGRILARTTGSRP